MRDVGKPERVSAALSAFLDDRGLKEPLDRVAVLDRWSSAVGDQIAAVTRAVAVRGDTLFVEVQSSAWLHELTLMKPQILEQVNHSSDGPPFGRLVFRLSPDDSGDGP